MFKNIWNIQEASRSQIRTAFCHFLLQLSEFSLCPNCLNPRCKWGLFRAIGIEVVSGSRSSHVPPNSSLKLINEWKRGAFTKHRSKLRLFLVKQLIALTQTKAVAKSWDLSPIIATIWAQCLKQSSSKKRPSKKFQPQIKHMQKDWFPSL